MRTFLLLLFLTSTAFAYNFGSNTKLLVDELEVNNASNITMLSNVIFDLGTANTVPFFNASKQLESSAVTDTELGYLSGVTSAIQTQLDAKLESPVDLTSEITGILPIANGGTGSATQNFVDLTTNQSIAGEKTFSSDVFFTSTGAIQIPNGTTGERPTGVAGKLRYNSTEGKFEGYTTVWGEIGGGIDIGASTDNAIVRWDGTYGTTVQDSSVLVDDSDNITGIVDLSADELQLNGATNDASSILDVSGTTQGTRPFTRVTEVQRDAISTPADGLLVYNTDTDKLNIYNGSDWVGLGDILASDNTCAVRVANSGTPNLTSSGGGCYASLTDNGTGDISVNFTGSYYTVAPAVVCTSEGTPNRVIEVDTLTTSLARIKTARGSDGTMFDIPFGCVFVKQGVDFEGPISAENVMQTIGAVSPRYYSAKVSSSGTVSGEIGTFINGNCTNAAPSVCTLEAAVFDSTNYNCNAEADTSSQVTCTAHTETATTFSVTCFNNSSDTDVTTSTAKKVFCHGIE